MQLIFEAASDYLGNKFRKQLACYLWYFLVYISFYIVDKKIKHCCISITNEKKKALCIENFGHTTGNILVISFWPYIDIFYCQLYLQSM